MTRLFRLITLAGVMAVAAFGQTDSQKAAFEAADVHVSSSTSESSALLAPARVELLGQTMLGLIRLAYSVDSDHVAGGPSWLDVTRFEINAKPPAGSSTEAVRSMLQNLLAERFQLVIHQEEKPSPVFALTVAKRGPLMKESTPGQPTDCKRNIDGGVISLTCRNMTMSGLADTIQGAAPAYFTHPVIDQTKLKGEYDFTIKWVGKGRVGIPGADGEVPGVSMFEALEKQLGLKADQQMAPSTMWVVEKVNEKPAANPPGTLEKLPPPVTEFEVATIRPSLPDAPEAFSMRNGRIDAAGIKLKDLILFASGLDDDGSVVGGEKWLDTEKFEIIAKAAPTTSAGDLRAMLNTLLKERFKLATHTEMQPVPVYALTVPNKRSPKLKEADPSSRSGCKLGVESGFRTCTCQNTTLDQFAEKIRQMAGGYLDHRVVDLTGLKGSYDFAVSWSPVGLTLLPGRAQPAAGGNATAGSTMPSAAEPAATLTIFEAVEKQLGLRLAAQKHPMPVVVLDHVERMPTEN